VEPARDGPAVIDESAGAGAGKDIVDEGQRGGRGGGSEGQLQAVNVRAVGGGGVVRAGAVDDRRGGIPGEDGAAKSRPVAAARQSKRAQAAGSASSGVGVEGAVDDGEGAAVEDCPAQAGAPAATGTERQVA